MLSVYEGKRDYPVKCQLYAPVYEGEGNTKTAIAWIPSDIFCWCKEIEKFGTSQRVEGSRRIRSVKGSLETKTLGKDEITLDYKICYEGDLYIITEIIQRDDERQQVLSRKPVVKTTLQVRR